MGEVQKTTEAGQTAQYFVQFIMMHQQQTLLLANTGGFGNPQFPLVMSLTNVVTDMARRKQAGDVTSTLEKLWAKLGKIGDKAAVITGATGVEPATSEERAFLKAHGGLPVRATGTIFGHTMEAQFPLGLAIAALSLSRGALFPSAGAPSVEVEMSDRPSQIVVIGTGHWRGEGMALVEAI